MTSLHRSHVLPRCQVPRHAPANKAQLAEWCCLWPLSWRPLEKSSQPDDMLQLTAGDQAAMAAGMDAAFLAAAAAAQGGARAATAAAAGRTAECNGVPAAAASGSNEGAKRPTAGPAMAAAWLSEAVGNGAAIVDPVSGEMVAAGGDASRLHPLK